MRTPLRTVAILIAAGASLGACTHDGYYGGGLAIGYGNAGYYDPYYDDWGYYSSSPYWGWYDGYYYPGTGIYIYDRWRRPIRWSDHHRRYWTGRHAYWRGRGDFREDRREFRDNWRDFRSDRRVDNRAFRAERRDDRRAFRQGEVTREEFRADRRVDRRDYRQERRQDRRALRRENRRDRRD